MLTPPRHALVQSSAPPVRLSAPCQPVARAASHRDELEELLEAPHAALDAAQHEPREDVRVLRAQQSASASSRIARAERERRRAHANTRVSVRKDVSGASALLDRRLRSAASGLRCPELSTWRARHARGARAARACSDLVCWSMYSRMTRSSWQIAISSEPNATVPRWKRAVVYIALPSCRRTPTQTMRCRGRARERATHVRRACGRAGERTRRSAPRGRRGRPDPSCRRCARTGEIGYLFLSSR